MATPAQPDEHPGHHRVAASSSGTATAQRSDAPGLQGKGPGGMWWVAWRQHRMQIATLLGIMAVLAAGLAIFRAVIVARWTAAGCDFAGTDCVDADGVDVWWNSGFSDISPMLHLAMLAAPVVFGAFVGAPLFTREFAHGTHVFALTQSVGRFRWWTAKLAVTVVPLLAGLVGLGMVMAWLDDTVGITADQSLNPVNFAVRSIIPAAHGLIAFALGVAAGILLRSTVAALTTTVIIGGLIAIGMIFLMPYVLPAERHVTPIKANLAGAVSDYEVATGMDPNVRWVVGGYLDADGRELDSGAIGPCFGTAHRAGAAAIDQPYDPDSLQVQVPAEDQDAYDAASSQALLDCARARGIVASYGDYLPGSMLWPLRWTVTGVSVILAALFFALGAWRLRPSIAKR